MTILLNFLSFFGIIFDKLLYKSAYEKTTTRFFDVFIL